ncbi:MAG: hypothetical protein ABI860_08385, partial [Gemmatimonadales bacterium]
MATRCPGCGSEFPPAAEPHGGRVDWGWFRPTPGAVVAVLAAGAVVVAAVFGRPGGTPLRPLDEETSSVPATVRLDTAEAAASPAGRPGGRAKASERRVARTWTKVRNQRSTAADVEAVLLPGDTVAVDSLSRGWW